MGRVAVFLDLANLYYRVGQRFKTPSGLSRKVNFRKYLQYASQWGTVCRVVAYGNSSTNDDSFGYFLRNLGVETKFRVPKLQVVKATEFYDSTYLVEMALDVVCMLPRIDSVVLGSANPNFVALANYIRLQGASCIAYACSIPISLRDSVNKDFEINESVLEDVQ